MMKYYFVAILIFNLFLEANDMNSTKNIPPSKGVVVHKSTIAYSGKPIMLMFDSQTCAYCEKMKREISQEPTLHKVATEFDLYSIPRDQPQRYKVLGNSTTTEDLKALYKVKVTPYIVLLTSKGEKIWQIPGYVKPNILAKVMKFVKGVDTGKYKKEEWKEYLKQNGVI